MWCTRCDHEITSPRGVCFNCTDRNDIVEQLRAQLAAERRGTGDVVDPREGEPRE